MVPRTIHFIWVPGEFSFGPVHGLTIQSAAMVNPDCRLVLHCAEEPTGQVWAAVRDLVEIESVSVPIDCFGVALRHPAHRTDFLRLALMREIGGIFLDLDVICVRPFSLIGDGSFVAAWQSSDRAKGIGCSVMLAEPRALFVDRWITGYDPKESLWHGFRSRGYDEFWGEMSTRYPAMLAKRFPEDIDVLPHVKFYPYGFEDDDLEGLFRKSQILPTETLCVHLWEMRSWDRYLKALDFRRAPEVESTFTDIIEPVIRRMSG